MNALRRLRHAIDDITYSPGYMIVGGGAAVAAGLIAIRHTLDCGLPRYTSYMQQRDWQWGLTTPAYMAAITGKVVGASALTFRAWPLIPLALLYDYSKELRDRADRKQS
jgi:hypothetical protein